MTKTLLLLLIPVFYVLTIPSCTDKGGFLGLGGDDDDGPSFPLTGVPCGSGNACPNASECDENRRCNCPDPTTEIRPGFCYFNDMNNVFITFDKIGRVVDTMILGFETDPADQDIVNSPGDQVSLSGQFVTSTSSGWNEGGVGFLRRTGLPEQYRDSVVITTLPSGSVNGYLWSDGYRCQTWFYGELVHPDTIRGELRFLLCNDSVPGVTRPLGADSTHAMVWVRR